MLITGTVTCLIHWESKFYREFTARPAEVISDLLRLEILQWMSAGNCTSWLNHNQPHNSSCPDSINV